MIRVDGSEGGTKPRSLALLIHALQRATRTGGDCGTHPWPATRRRSRTSSRRRLRASVRSTVGIGHRIAGSAIDDSSRAQPNHQRTGIRSRPPHLSRSIEVFYALRRGARQRSPSPGRVAFHPRHTAREHLSRAGPLRWVPVCVKQQKDFLIELSLHLSRACLGYCRCFPQCKKVVKKGGVLSPLQEP